MRTRPILLLSGFLLALMAGFWLARTAAPVAVRQKPTAAESPKPRQIPDVQDPDPIYRRDRPAFVPDEEALRAGALIGQRSLVFKDRASLERFLARAGGRMKVLSRLDALHALRLGFLAYQDLAELLDGSEEIGMIFPAFFPENETVAAQAGAVPLGDDLLNWLGITGEHSTWGAGVKIAVLDTGVSQHPAFGTIISALGPSGDVNGHGTAVASMILGNTTNLPGVAPGSTVLSIQIADSEGFSDSFKIAEGILAAIEAGVDVINISMGSSSDSSILSAAIAKAVEAGVMIIAPTGNSGLDRVFYPAANKGVIAVGAVDKNGQLLAFSNTGDAVALAAPGYGLNAAYLNDTAASVSGTSFSSPIIAGMIAATMSQTGLNAAESWKLISANLNEAGEPGADSSLGGGLPSMDRILNAGARGRYDAAVASHWIATGNGRNELLVTIQNRGTETLINSKVEVTSPRGTQTFNATSLAPGTIQTFSVPLSASSSAMRFESKVTLSGGQTDIRPGNNRRVETYTPVQNR